MRVTGALLTSLALSACSQETQRAGDEDSSVPVSVLASDDAKQRGRLIFEARCSICHGTRADGKGARSKGLSGKPADFTSPEWRDRVTPTYVYGIVSEGKRGTSMPAWPTLTDAQKWDVIAYVLSISQDGAR